MSPAAPRKPHTLGNIQITTKNKNKIKNPQTTKLVRAKGSAGLPRGFTVPANSWTNSARLSAGSAAGRGAGRMTESYTRPQVCKGTQLPHPNDSGNTPLIETTEQPPHWFSFLLCFTIDFCFLSVKFSYSSISPAILSKAFLQKSSCFFLVMCFLINSHINWILFNSLEVNITITVTEAFYHLNLKKRYIFPHFIKLSKPE